MSDADDMVTYLVTADTRRGTIFLEVSTFQGKDAAERRALWVLASQRKYGDLDEIAIASVVPLP